MLRELSMRRARRRDSNASPPPQTPPTQSPPKPPRSLTSLPRRLSRGPGSFHRTSSLLSRSKPPKPESQTPAARSSRLPRTESARRARPSKSDMTAARGATTDEPVQRVFVKRPGHTLPLVSVDELFKWRPTGLAAKCVSRVPLAEAAVRQYVRRPGMQGTVPHAAPPLSAVSMASRGAAGSLRRLQPPRLLLCHDFRGGYPDWEASADGVVGDDVPEEGVWRFNHWAYVDIFVYFSHYCVTIPPVGYIHAAHRHGSLCLGTLIFEWDSGAEQLSKILMSFKTRAKAASQLAAIAKFYGFDGWLVNVEVQLAGGSSAASDLAAFVGDLTRATRKIVGPVSEVIWYDSVTRDGSLNWQNELNQDNEQFFKAAGSIFTNYHWDRNAPVRSAVKAGTRRTDVFTGIDIYGRNTYGGGGFQTHLALRAIKQGGTSAALFAPGWTVEKCPANIKDPRQLEERFWTGPSGRFRSESVAQYFRERPVITQLPFSTTFDPGWGPRQMRNGIVKSEKRYFNMAQQQIQPSFMRTCVASGDTTSTELCLSHEQAYNGSASMKTQFAFSESRMLSGSYSILRLFVANLSFPARLSSRITKSQDGALRVSYNYLAKADQNLETAASDFGLVLFFSNPVGAVLLVGEESKWNDSKSEGRRRALPRLQILGKFVNYQVCVATSDKRSVGSRPEEGSTGWMSRTFVLEGSITSGQRLAEVMIIAGGPPQQPVSVRPSPFMSPSVSRGVSRNTSRNGSRMSSRIGSAAVSRSNSPPRGRPDGYEGESRYQSRIPSRGHEELGEMHVVDRLEEGKSDAFGTGLLSQYRESFGIRRRSEYSTAGNRGVSELGERPFNSAFERRQESMPGVFERRLGNELEEIEGMETSLPYRGGRAAEPPRRQGSSTYASNFQVEGSIDFDNMVEEDHGMYSASTSRALSRLGSRLATPIGSRPLSRLGSRLGSVNASRAGSIGPSLSASRTGSLAGSRLGSRQNSRFASPSATPRGGGNSSLSNLHESVERKLSMSAAPLGSLRNSGSQSGATTPSRSGPSLGDLKSALMQAAGSMAGDSEFVATGGGSAACTVYLGSLKLEVITETDQNLPAVFR